jgi:hypothetical protein
MNNSSNEANSLKLDKDIEEDKEEEDKDEEDDNELAD